MSQEEASRKALRLKNGGWIKMVPLWVQKKELPNRIVTRKRKESYWKK